MRLLLPSLCLVAYVAVSFLSMMPWRLTGRLFAVLLLVSVSLKYVMYEKIGGAFFAPALPPWLILTAEALYASLLLLFILLIVKDGVTLLLWISRLLGSSWHIPVPRAILGSGLLAVALVLGFWGSWQGARVPDVRSQEVFLPGLPPALDGLVIVQLSDLHIGPLLGERWLEGVVERTNALAPDLIVISGDFIDGSPGMIGEMLKPLSLLRAENGVYGVTGNHEYYFDVRAWLPVFAQHKIRMLRNEHQVVRIRGEELVLAGVNDTVASQFGDAGPDVDKALQGAPEAVRILLAHQPRGAASHTSADLQISGHTHGGTMLFMKPFIASFNDGFVGGLYTVKDMLLYVSPGTGVWNGFSSRIGVPSEITRLVLRTAAKQDVNTEGKGSGQGGE